MLEIRKSSAEDIETIKALHLAAFGEEEREVVAKLAVDLISSDPLALSLVACLKDEVVGHIVYTPCSISGHEELTPFILAPLGVSPCSQKTGVGSRLIEYGLAELKTRGVDIVFVLGDPAYYSRSGFHVYHKINPPHSIPYPEAWQVIELKPDVLENVTGQLSCVPELMSKDLW